MVNGKFGNIVGGITDCDFIRENSNIVRDKNKIIPFIFFDTISLLSLKNIIKYFFYNSLVSVFFSLICLNSMNVNFE